MILQYAVAGMFMLQILGLVGMKHNVSNSQQIVGVNYEVISMLVIFFVIGFGLGLRRYRVMT